MTRKIYLQLFILLIALTISFFFYNTYISKEKLEVHNQQILIENNEANVLENIEYTSEDKKGNLFLITSEKGTIDNLNAKITKMYNVKSLINLKNNQLIKINSSKALYNRETNNSLFYDKVNIQYEKNQITSEKLELLFSQNLMLISENVIYKSLNSELKADRVEIDLNTKNVKILLDKKKDKVKIKLDD